MDLLTSNNRNNEDIFPVYNRETNQPASNIEIVQNINSISINSAIENSNKELAASADDKEYFLIKIEGRTTGKYIKSKLNEFCAQNVKSFVLLEIYYAPKISFKDIIELESIVIKNKIPIEVRAMNYLYFNSFALMIACSTIKHTMLRFGNPKIEMTLSGKSISVDRDYFKVVNLIARKTNYKFHLIIRDCGNEKILNARHILRYNLVSEFRSIYD